MDESPPVLCTLHMEAWREESRELRENALKKVSDAFAAHDSFLCWSEEPCVVICKGCTSRNVASILVHESIHHALLWINGVGFEDEDHFDDLVQFMDETGIGRNLVSTAELS